MKRSLLWLTLCLGLWSASYVASYGAIPQILDVQIDRGWDLVAPSAPGSHQRVTVQASDADGAADIASISVVCPGGWGEIWLDPTSMWNIWQVQDATTVKAVGDNGPYPYESAWYALPVPAGSYTITVSDKSGNTSSLTTAVVPAVVERPHPSLLAPVAEGVISESMSTFQWTDAVPARAMWCA